MFKMRKAWRRGLLVGVAAYVLAQGGQAQGGHAQGGQAQSAQVQSAQAQNAGADLSGWSVNQASSGSDRIMLSHHSGAIVMATPSTLSVGDTWLKIAPVVEEKCPGMARAMRRVDLRLYGAVTGKEFDCAVSIRAAAHGEGAVAVVLFAPKGSTIAMQPTVSALADMLAGSMTTATPREEPAQPTAMTQPQPQGQPQIQAPAPIDRAQLPSLAKLKAASAALPAAVHNVTLIKHGHYNGWNQYVVQLYMLFPGGLATQCPQADLGAMRISREWFKALGCETATWRRKGNKVELLVDGGTTWDGDTYDLAPSPYASGAQPNIRMRTSSGGTIMGGEGQTSAMSAGDFVMCADGTLTTSMEHAVVSNANGVNAAAGSGRQATTMAYYIHGRVITLGFADGRIVHRYIAFDREGTSDYIHFDDNFYFTDD